MPLTQSISSIGRAIEPRDVLDAVQKRSDPFNSNAYFHDSVLVKYRQDYLASLPRRGEGPMSRYAKTGPLPFTFTGARLEIAANCPQ